MGFAYLICIIPLVVNSLTFFDRIDTFSFVLPYSQILKWQEVC